MKIGLCLLVWNEVHGLKNTVPKIPMEMFDEVFALDGGSDDGTIEYLTKAQIKIIHQKEKGYNAAYIEAFKSTNVDFLIVFHPKDTIDTKYLSDCVELANQGYDLVVASRNLANAQNEEDCQLFRPRKWFVLTIAAISAAIWRKEGNMVWDVLHGFRGMRVSSFFEMNPDPHGISMDLEIVIWSYKRRLSRIEFPVVEVSRSYNTTHFKAIPTGWKLLKTLGHEIVCKNDSFSD